ncbi:MAG: hypothetical protein ABR907_12200 [Terracidiphilus sp.]
MFNEPEAVATAHECSNECGECTGECQESHVLRVLGWLSVGVAVAVVGVFVGRELRNRYKFNHRTPYDFYAHAGEQQTGEFGMGV